MQGLFILGSLTASFLLVLVPTGLFALMVKNDGVGFFTLFWIMGSLLSVGITWFIISELYWKENNE
jgi:hypothetical protein